MPTLFFLTHCDINDITFSLIIYPSQFSPIHLAPSCRRTNVFHVHLNKLFLIQSPFNKPIKEFKGQNFVSHFRQNREEEKKVFIVKKDCYRVTSTQQKDHLYDVTLSKFQNLPIILWIAKFLCQRLLKAQSLKKT